MCLTQPWIYFSRLSRLVMLQQFLIHESVASTRPLPLACRHLPPPDARRVRLQTECRRERQRVLSDGLASSIHNAKNAGVFVQGDTKTAPTQISERELY